MKKKEIIIFNQSKIGWTQIDTSFFKKLLKVNRVNFLPLIEVGAKKNDVDFRKTADINEIYKSISLYDICIYSICNELKIFKDELSVERHACVINKWFYIAKNTISKLEIVFKQNNVKGVIIFHGHLLFDACLLALSKINKVRYLTLEITSNKERVVWDNLSGYVVTYNLAKNYFAKEQCFLNKDVVEHYCEKYKSEIHTYKRLDHSSNIECLDLPFKEPYVLFIGQVYNDASQLFTLNDDFDNPVKIIKKANLISQNLGYKFVLKLHPKEINGKDPVMHDYYDEPTYSRVKELHNCNQVFIDRKNEYDTFKLISSSSLIITVNSQAGLEACIFNKPVLSYSKGFYSGLGFTYDYSNSSELESLMNYIASNQLLENRNLSNARSFFYVFFEKYCIERSENSLLSKVIEVFELNIKPKKKFFVFSEKVVDRILKINYKYLWKKVKNKIVY